MEVILQNTLFCTEMIIENVQYWLCMVCLYRGWLASHFISLQLYNYRLHAMVHNNRFISRDAGAQYGSISMGP
jgi:hypothetical protein